MINIFNQSSSSSNNDQFIHVLKQDKETCQIFIDKVEIERNRYVDSAFKNLISKLKSDDYNCDDIVHYIKYQSKLRILLKEYDYCTQLDQPYQGLLSYLKPSKITGKPRVLKLNKDEFIDELKNRLRAFYLEEAYTKCAKNKELLAYSHRKVGWSMPKYKLNPDFTIELKTNFGYGKSSYFYTKISYKNLDIIPFSDWINYERAKIYEIIGYSSKHELIDDSWEEAMNYISEACNLSMKNEVLFIQKHVINQCDEMTKGLEQILTNDKYHFKKSKLLNLEKSYVNMKSDEHNLVELKGERISGALELIYHIKKLEHIIEVKDYIKNIENLNIKVKPMIIKEQINVSSKLTILEKDRLLLKPIYDRLLKKEKQFIKEKNKLLLNTSKTSNYTYQEIIDNKFNSLHPDYHDFDKEFKDISERYTSLILKKTNVSKTLKNLIQYENNITSYFSV